MALPLKRAAYLGIAVALGAAGLPGTNTSSFADGDRGAPRGVSSDQVDAAPSSARPSWAPPGAVNVGVPRQSDAADAPTTPDIADELTPYERKHERKRRESLGFDIVDSSIFAQNPEAAAAGLAEVGIRLVPDELAEFRQRQALSRPASDLKASLLEDPRFAGIYFDTPAGKYVIRMTEVLPEDADRITDYIPVDRFRIENATYSIAELNDLADRLVPTNLGVVEVDAVPSELRDHVRSGALGVSVSDRENVVRVFADVSVPVDAIDYINRVLGERGYVVPAADGGDDVCDQQDCHPRIDPGLRFNAEKPSLGGSGWGYCTIGGPYRSSDGQTTYLSSAGHCYDANGAGFGTDMESLENHFGGNVSRRTIFGTATLRQDTATLDASIMEFPRDLADRRPWDTTSRLSAFTWSYGLNGVTEGETMQVSAGNTKNVLTTEFYGYLTKESRVVGVLEDDYTIGGDSGGPWFEGTNYAGHHIGNHLMYEQGAWWSRDYFEQVQVLENRWGVVFKTVAIAPQRLVNNDFSPNLASWNLRSAPGGSSNWQRYNNWGMHNEDVLQFNCAGSVANCSVYQDVAISTGNGVRLSAGVWLFCDSTNNCPATVAVWWLGGSGTTGNLNQAVTVPSLEPMYVTIDGVKTGGTTSTLRFEVYNGHSGANLSVTQPQMHR